VKTLHDTGITQFDTMSNLVDNMLIVREQEICRVFQCGSTFTVEI